MVIETNIQMTGMEELEKVLLALPRELAERDLASSLRKGANVIKDAAAEKVPVDEGDLKDSLQVRKQKTNPGEVSLVLSTTKPKGFHGHLIEFGTVNTPPQPFMRPAFDEKQGEAITVMVESLSKKLTNTAVKLSGKFAKSGLAKRRRRR